MSCPPRRRRRDAASIAAVARTLIAAAVAWTLLAGALGGLGRASGAGATPGAPDAAWASTTIAAGGPPPAPSSTLAPPPSAPQTPFPPRQTPSTTAAPTTTLPSIQVDTVTADYLARARADVGRAQAVFTAAQKVATAAAQRAATASATFTSIGGRIDALGAAEREAEIEAERAHVALRDFAVNVYVNGGGSTEVAVLMGAQSITEFARRRALMDATAHAGSVAVDDLRRARDAMSRSGVLLNDEFERASAADADANRALQADTFSATQAAATLATKKGLLAVIEAALPAGATDIPTLMADAYRRAAVTVDAEGCTLGWWGLAGIGKVESDHGREGAPTLALNGDLSPPILGPALDGTGGTQAVPATDGGAMTGDPVWDHAVGPMQFIPSTWRRWGADGNGDGVVNPNNAYDAALGAARYLCASSGDLQSDAGLGAAVHAYNHDDAYVAEVLAFAHLYRG